MAVKSVSAQSQQDPLSFHRQHHRWPGSPDSRALLPVIHSSKATVELQYFTWCFFFPPHAHEAEMGSGVEPLQSSKALSTARPCPGLPPFHERAEGKQEAQVQDKEQKSQGNVTGVVISTHAKVPSAFFFFPL